jgi:hypothetical protein
MPKRKITLALLASMVALLVVTGAHAQAPGPLPLPPYTGVIKNNSSHDISIPSENSLATLIVPARGWIEFVVWDPKFQLIPYLDGQPYGCQKVRVQPQAFPYMCKNYDFLVEIMGPVPAKKEYYKKLKRRYRRPRNG